MDYSADWKRGTRLAEAWTKFCSPQMWEEYDRYTPGDIHGTPPDPMSVDQNDPEVLRRTLFQLAEQAGFVEPPIAAQMRDAVLVQLQKGRLVALGIPVNPLPSHDAVRIPETMFAPRFMKWHKSAIEGGGFRYRDVRVIRAARGKKPDASATASAGQTRKAVTPRTEPQPNPSATTSIRLSDRRKQEIVAEFRAIPSSEKSKRGRMTIVGMVLTRLEKKNLEIFKNGKGLTDKNIYRILSSTSEF